MNADELKERIKDFSHRCVKLGLALPTTVLGNHIKSRLIKCSTSAVANYRAVCLSQSKSDFIAKLSIVIEETDESCFWMQFIVDEQLLKERRVCHLLKEGQELTSIFMSSRRTARGLKNSNIVSF